MGFTFFKQKSRFWDPACAGLDWHKVVFMALSPFRGKCSDSSPNLLSLAPKYQENIFTVVATRKERLGVITNKGMFL